MANSKMLRAAAAVMGLAVHGLFPTDAVAAACTPGVDCYCDRVKGDSATLLCEDLEAPTLRLAAGVGNGPPFYGPWWDDTDNGPYSSGGFRGANSYWHRKYGTGVSSFRTPAGAPVSPLNGAPCANQHGLCGNSVWLAGDLNSTNGLSPQLAILSSDADFSAEVSTLGPPSNAAGGGDGVFDGNASLGFRIPAGRTVGIAGEGVFSSAKHLGITYAVALPINHVSSGLSSGPYDSWWKWNEFAQVNTPNTNLDGLAGFGYSPDVANANHPQFPFYGFIVESGGCTSSTLRNMQANKGRAWCDSAGFRWLGGTAYQFPRDWPLGTWACIRVDIDLSNPASARIVQSIQTSVLKTETTVVDISGLDFSNFSAAGGWNAIKWNDYANTNQGFGGIPTSVLTFRYEDNWHIRNGASVPCAQIGFGGGGADAKPSAPTGLTVQ